MPPVAEAPITTEKVSFDTTNGYSPPPEVPGNEAAPHESMLNPFLLLQESPVMPYEKPRSIPYEQLAALKDGFIFTDKPLRPVFPDGADIFHAPSHPERTHEHTYAHAVTENGIRWELNFDMNHISYYPFTRNYDMPITHGNNATDVDLTDIYAQLKAKEIKTPDVVQAHDIEHRLLEALLDQNTAEFVESWTGEQVDDSEVLIVKEPEFFGMGTPDRVYIIPHLNLLLPADVYQHRKDASRNTKKSRQFRQHIQAIKGLFAEIYGEDIQPNIVPILIKFRLDQPTKTVTMRPFISRSDTHQLLPLAA